MAILSNPCHIFITAAIIPPVPIFKCISVVGARHFFPWPSILKQYDIHGGSININNLLHKPLETEFQTVYRKQTTYSKVYNAASMYDVTTLTTPVSKPLKQFSWCLHSSGMYSTLDVWCLTFWEHAAASSTFACPVKTLDMRLLNTMPLLGFEMGSNRYLRTDQNVPEELRPQG